MTSTSENVYINKLDDIIDKCNNTYHRATKMKPIVLKTGTYVDNDVENNEKMPNLKLMTT